MERFTILICTFNRAASLAETLEAVAALDPGPGFEVLVVDNGSTDGTADAVGAAASRYPVPVRYLREVRLGKSAALNSGIADARGDIVVFTDDDAKPQKDWLARLGAAFDQYDADWVFGRVVPEWTGGAPRWFSPALNGAFALLDYGPAPLVVTSEAQMFFGVNCAATRHALSALGRYRTDLGPGQYGGGGEDLDMFRRALAAGMRVVYAPDATVAHVIPQHRTRKPFHRRRLFRARALDHKLVTEAAQGPTILGLPRYMYRMALGEAAAYVGAWARWNEPAAFAHELHLVRFAGLFECAARSQLKAAMFPRRPGTPP